MAQADINMILQEFTNLVNIGDLNQGMGAVALQEVVEEYLGNFDNMANALTTFDNYIAGLPLNQREAYAVIRLEINDQDYLFDLQAPAVPAIVPDIAPAPAVPAIVPDIAPAAGGSRKKRKRSRRRKRNKNSKRKASKGGSRKVRKCSNRKSRNSKSRKSRRTRKRR